MELLLVRNMHAYETLTVFVILAMSYPHFLEGSDFIRLAHIVSFGPGDRKMCVILIIIEDSSAEGSEMFAVTIAKTPGITVGPDTEVTIVDERSMSIH